MPHARGSSAPNLVGRNNLKTSAGVQDILPTSHDEQHKGGDYQLLQTSPNHESQSELESATSHVRNDDPSLSQTKLPAYLTGKNPYGQILEQVDHPYRERKQVSGAPPSQLGSNIEGRPRTAGSFNFKTRPAPSPQPLPKASSHSSPVLPLLPPERPPKTEAFRAAKSFFESRALESQKEASPQPKGVGHIQRSSLTTKFKPSTVASGVVATPSNNVAVEGSSLTRRRSANVLSQPQQVAKPLGDERYRKFQHDKADKQPRTATDSVAKRKAGSQATSTESTGYDGSSSQLSFEPNLNQHMSLSAMIPVDDLSVEDGYYSIEVPDHIDDRGAYGRRNTLDFGYPSARIKPIPTLQTYKAPLRDPGRWTKRSCGHFSSIQATELESIEEAAKRPCNQCSSTENPSLESREYPKAKPSFRPSQKKTETDLYFPSIAKRELRRKPRRGRHPSNQSAHNTPLSERTEEDIVHDLSSLIDSILQEHQTVLQKVITNIEASRYPQQRQRRLDPTPPPIPSQSISGDRIARPKRRKMDTHLGKCWDFDGPRRATYRASSPSPPSPKTATTTASVIRKLDYSSNPLSPSQDREQQGYECGSRSFVSGKESSSFPFSNDHHHLRTHPSADIASQQDFDAVVAGHAPSSISSFSPAATTPNLDDPALPDRRRVQQSEETSGVSGAPSGTLMMSRTTAEEVIGMIRKAACELGVDLERGVPGVGDDEEFENAAWE